MKREYNKIIVIKRFKSERFNEITFEFVQEVIT